MNRNHTCLFLRIFDLKIIIFSIKIENLILSGVAPQYDIESLIPLFLYGVKTLILKIGLVKEYIL